MVHVRILRNDEKLLLSNINQFVYINPISLHDDCYLFYWFSQFISIFELFQLINNSYHITCAIIQLNLGHPWK